MATETVPPAARDYLGHPCQITDAFERFSEPVKEARKLEPRALVREIGIRLNELVDRGQQSGNALEFARDSLGDPDTAEQVQGVLALAAPFGVESDNRLYVLAGYVLVALEQGKLLEVSHG